MSKRLAQAGAIIALVGGAIGTVGAVVLVLRGLYYYGWPTTFEFFPSWLGFLEILVGVGVAIFSVGASLALWGLVSELPPPEVKEGG